MEYATKTHTLKFVTKSRGKFLCAKCRACGTEIKRGDQYATVAKRVKGFPFIDYNSVHKRCIHCAWMLAYPMFRM